MKNEAREELHFDHRPTAGQERKTQHARRARAPGATKHARTHTHTFTLHQMDPPPDEDMGDALDFAAPPPLLSAAAPVPPAHHLPRPAAGAAATGAGHSGGSLGGAPSGMGSHHELTEVRKEREQV